MNTIKKALKRTAYEFDVPLSEVQKEIQDIIDECYNSTDKEIYDRWRQICPNGEKPTPEQLITYATAMIKNKQNDTLQTSNRRSNFFFKTVQRGHPVEYKTIMILSSYFLTLLLFQNHSIKIV